MKNSKLILSSAVVFLFLIGFSLASELTPSEKSSAEWILNHVNDDGKLVRCCEDFGVMNSSSDYDVVLWSLKSAFDKTKNKTYFEKAEKTADLVVSELEKSKPKCKTEDICTCGDLLSRTRLIHGLSTMVPVDEKYRPYVEKFIKKGWDDSHSFMGTGLATLTELNIGNVQKAKEIINNSQCVREMNSIIKKVGDNKNSEGWFKEYGCYYSPEGLMALGLAYSQLNDKIGGYEDQQKELTAFTIDSLSNDLQVPNLKDKIQLDNEYLLNFETKGKKEAGYPPLRILFGTLLLDRANRMEENSNIISWWKELQEKDGFYWQEFDTVGTTLVISTKVKTQPEKIKAPTGFFIRGPFTINNIVISSIMLVLLVTLLFLASSNKKKIDHMYSDFVRETDLKEIQKAI